MKQAVVVLIAVFLILGCGKKDPVPAKDGKSSEKAQKQAEKIVEDQLKSGELQKKIDKTEAGKTAEAVPEKTAVKMVPKKTPEQLEAEKKAAELAKEWELVFEDDFSDTNVTDRWEFVEGTWTVEKGELVGKGDAAHIAILKKDIVGDVRIEFDVHIDSDFLNDVSCFFSAKVADPRIKTYNTGYLLQYGGYTNTKNDIMRDGFAMAEEEASPLKKGVKYRMTAFRKGKVISYSIDGKEVLKTEDPEMLNAKENSKLGLYAWGGDNYYDNVKIYKAK